MSKEMFDDLQQHFQGILDKLQVHNCYVSDKFLVEDAYNESNFVSITIWRDMDTRKLKHLVCWAFDGKNKDQRLAMRMDIDEFEESFEKAKAWFCEKVSATELKVFPIYRNKTPEQQDEDARKSESRH